MNTIERLSPDTANAIRKTLGLEPGDTSKDDYLSRLSDQKLFERYCEANGIIGWSDLLMNALDSIRAAQKPVKAVVLLDPIKSTDNETSAVAQA